MTIISVRSPKGGLDVDAQRLLVKTLNDAVLEPELGQMFQPARMGFQVLFNEFERDRVAIGGRLLSDCEVDVIAIDVAVMDGDWPVELRGSVIRRLLRALADPLGREQPISTWWVTFRTIDEGSWGSRGGPLSILSLLESGAFSAERDAEISHAFAPTNLISLTAFTVVKLWNSNLRYWRPPANCSGLPS